VFHHLSVRRAGQHRQEQHTRRWLQETLHKDALLKLVAREVHLCVEQIPLLLPLSVKEQIPTARDMPKESLPRAVLQVLIEGVVSQGHQTARIVKVRVIHPTAVIGLG
jgi:hypothetical protein